MQPRPRTVMAPVAARRDRCRKMLWRALRESGTAWKFRRQHAIGKHIADFACPARKLVIELDDGQHDAQTGADDARSAALAEYGYRAVRFWEQRRRRKCGRRGDGYLAGVGAAPTSPRPSPPPGAEREIARVRASAGALGRRGGTPRVQSTARSVANRRPTCSTRAQSCRFHVIPQGAETAAGRRFRRRTGPHGTPRRVLEAVAQESVKIRRTIASFVRARRLRGAGGGGSFTCSTHRRSVLVSCRSSPLACRASSRRRLSP
jgi:very-short-patch-repair endonuclease